MMDFADEVANPMVTNAAFTAANVCTTSRKRPGPGAALDVPEGKQSEAILMDPSPLIEVHPF